MKFDALIDEVPINNVKRLARIVGPDSAAAKALEWAHNARETCYFFRTRVGTLVVVRESVLKEVEPLKNIELEKHFVTMPESQYVSCVHCGKTRIKNQGLAKLSHLANCTRPRWNSKDKSNPLPQVNKAAP